MDDSWDLETIALMEDDCLEFVRRLYVDIYLYKYTKICTYLLLLLHVPLWSIQFYYSLKTLDVYFVVQYGPASLVFLFAFISMMIPVVYETHLKRCFDIKKQISWSLGTASEELQNKMLKAAKYFTYVAKVNLILGLITYSLVLARFEARKEWEIIHQITFIKENFPEYATVLIVIFHISLIYFVIAMMYMIYILSYFTLHLVFQALMANERVTRITEHFSNDIELVSNDIYQRQVSKRLRFCVSRLGTLKSFAEYSLSIIPLLVVTYVILGMLLLICYVGTWYLNPDKYYPLIVAITVNSAYCGLIAVEMGQLADTQSLETYYFLIDLPWYTFNVKNQKILLFTFMHAVSPLKLSPYEAFPVNRRMIVQFYKVFSSLSALLANSKDKFVK